MGSCEAPSCCGDPPCKNYWGSYCYEHHSLADAMRGAIACARARRCCASASRGCTTSGCTTRNCTTRNCTTRGCTTRGCTTPGCATAPQGTLQSPFLDDPPTPPEAAAGRPRTIRTSSGRTLLPLPPSLPVPPPLGRAAPRIHSFHSFNAISRTAYEEADDGEEAGNVESAPLSLQILTLPNGAHLVHNPYCKSAADAVPRVLSDDQQSGVELASMPEAIELVAPETTAAAPEQRASDELSALPAMIRFVKPAN